MHEHGLMPRAPSAALLLLASLASAACSARNPIDPGAYTSHAPPYVGMQVSVSPDKQTVTFALPGGPTVKRSAKAWDPSKWPTLCPRGLKDTSSEVLDLGPDPLELAGTKIERPVLVADCTHKPILELMGLDTRGEVIKPAMASFER